MVAEQATEILSDHILIAHDLPDWLSIDDRQEVKFVNNNY